MYASAFENENSCSIDDRYVPVCHLPYASDYEDSVESQTANGHISGCMDIEQITRAYPDIKINEEEKRANLLFNEAMEKKKSEKKQKEFNEKFINKMLTKISKKAKKFKLRKTKKSAADHGDEDQSMAGECPSTPKKIKQSRFKNTSIDRYRLRI